MASSKHRLEANRANAKRSTGPNTEAGKARSKMNAVKHGLAAKAIVIEGEDPREFETLRAGLERDFDPQTVIERELVENLAALLWRQRRGHRFEAAVVQRVYVSCFTMSDKTRELTNGLIGNDILTKLARHESILANRIDRTISQLDHLLASRLEASATLRLIESANRPKGDAPQDNHADHRCVTPANSD
jgi:hypothetical protein